MKKPSHSHPSPAQRAAATAASVLAASAAPGAGVVPKADGTTEPEPEAEPGSAGRGAVFAVVGIGASAGGLEALEQFLGHVPLASGLAYVVVQHLDPTHKGIMVELLQRATPMPVAQVTEGQRLLPDHVYVIPPGRDLALLNGVLHLLEPAEQRGLRLPIDHFLRSLAADRREMAVGVILSGMGSDGTLGLRAIKENAGAAFVQLPASAKFDAMPRSAISAGLADVVARAEELPARILAFLKHVPRLVGTAPAQADSDPAADADDSASAGSFDIAKVVLLLRERTGHDFSLYRKSTLVRRIERRMALHQLPRVTDYVRLLRDNRNEAELLFQELLIGVTSFFRDPAVWEQLKAEVIPGLLAAHPEGGMLRAWVPACSTGEEAYGLAMVFKEALEQVAPETRLTLQIFATDLDKTAIDKARNGLYPAGIAADVSAPRLQRFFVEDENGFRVSKEIREMVVFATQNVVMDPPFTRLDLLTCRNLLIYLEPELQKKLIALFHYSLLPGGALLLGSAETVAAAADLFTALPGKARLFRRLGGQVYEKVGELPAVFDHNRPALVTPARVAGTVAEATLAAPNLKQVTEELLLQRFAPAAVLATAQGDIVYISGKTGRYLEPASGKANLNLISMARPGLDHALAESFHRAMRDQVAVALRRVKIGSHDGTVWVDVHIQPLAKPSTAQGLALVVFAELPPPAEPEGTGRTGRALEDRLLTLQQELQRAHEEVQSTREEMQASQEELKSANEEMQSTNEELQSANEELSTSKEEMQSMNEELQTVNHELVARVDELGHTGDDLNNLFNSTNVATLFLDANLGVRRFTPAMAKLIKLIPGDAGRPITDLVSTVDYPLLADDAREVLRTLAVIERQVPIPGGGWFAVRAMPYRTQDNRIDGLVIMFSDISSAKALEASLREAQAVLERRVAGQGADLDAARSLETVLRNAQALLENRIDDQATALKKANADLKARDADGPNAAP